MDCFDDSCGTNLPPIDPYQETYTFTLTRMEEIIEFKKVIKKIPFHQQLNNQFNRGCR